MTSHFRTSTMRGPSAFTLAEFVVSLGIIAVLFGLLLPYLSRVREQARQTYCLNNLRELRAATGSWTVYFAPAQCANLLQQANPKQAVCPSDDVRAHPVGAGGIQYPYSYTFNDSICRREPLPPLRVADVHFPAQKILVIDENTQTADDAGWNWRECAARQMNVLSARHNRTDGAPERDLTAGRGNVLFCDGHAELVDRSLVLDPRYCEPDGG